MMRRIVGKRINRINLEPYKSKSSVILQPFVFGLIVEQDLNLLITKTGFFIRYNNFMLKIKQ
jgi:hypothetical protein